MQPHLPAVKVRQLEAWITVQRGHALANGVHLLACNRVGHELNPTAAGHGIHFWGNSFACGPQGEMLGQAGEDGEIPLVDLDRRRSEQVRRDRPFLRDRRIDAYDALKLRFND